MPGAAAGVRAGDREQPGRRAAPCDREYAAARSAAGLRARRTRMPEPHDQALGLQPGKRCPSRAQSRCPPPARSGRPSARSRRPRAPRAATARAPRRSAPPPAGRPTPKSSSSTSCDAGDQDGAVAQQPIRPRGCARRDPARHRTHRAPEVAGEIRRDQRTRWIRGLHHHRHLGQRGHDPVARREAPPERPRAERQLGDHGPLPHDPLVEAQVLARIRDVDPARQHRNRPPTRVEAAAVRSAIDAKRQAADNDQDPPPQAPRPSS